MTVVPEERAQQLLPSVLNREERAHFYKTGEIIITGSRGGRYQIFRSSVTGNVKVLQDVDIISGFTRAGARICAHPPMVIYDYATRSHDYLPLTDGLISQILAIKADEDLFLRTAYFYSY